MSEQPQPPSNLSLVALRQRRESTIERLCDHFAADHLEAEELESLIDQAHAATSVAELEALTASLPALASQNSPVAAARDAAPYTPPKDISVVVAIMGGTERRYDTLPAREINVLALMGGVMLDFRHAHFPAGVTTIQICALMGGVEVIVPPDVQVDSSGIGIMGGFEHLANARFPVDLQRPVLRIVGVAIMGGVEITQRLPGESGKEAKQRLKYEARQRRLGGGEPPSI